MFISSFANYLLVSSFSDEEIWKVLKKIKHSISFEKTCNGALYSEMFDHKSIMEMVEKDLHIIHPNSIKFGYVNIESEPIHFANMTDAKLKTAAEMYFYILSCPGDLLPWFTFYSDLFLNKPPDQIVLILNRILKSKNSNSAKNIGLKKIAEKLFNFIATNSAFKYQDIKGLTQSKNTTILSDISSVKIKGKGMLVKLMNLVLDSIDFRF